MRGPGHSPITATMGDYLARSVGMRGVMSTVLHEEAMKQAGWQFKRICEECGYVPRSKANWWRLVPSESGESFLCVKCYHVVGGD